MNRRTSFWLIAALVLLPTLSGIQDNLLGASWDGEVVSSLRSRGKCNKCQQRRQCRKCPKCQNDVCVLSAECVKDKRTCFEVEQKLICIPKVSLPWRRCEKPCQGGCAANCRHKCAKTKVVKILKTKVYECDVCKYSWKVYEPQEANTTTQQVEQPSLEPGNDKSESTPDQPQFDNSELYDPSGEDVPKAPVVDESAKAILNRFKRL